MPARAFSFYQSFFSTSSRALAKESFVLTVSLNFSKLKINPFYGNRCQAFCVAVYLFFLRLKQLIKTIILALEGLNARSKHQIHHRWSNSFHSKHKHAHMLNKNWIDASVIINLQYLLIYFIKFWQASWMMSIFVFHANLSKWHRLFFVLDSKCIYTEAPQF